VAVEPKGRKQSSDLSQVSFADGAANHFQTFAACDLFHARQEVIGAVVDAMTRRHWQWPIGTWRLNPRFRSCGNPSAWPHWQALDPRPRKQRGTTHGRPGRQALNRACFHEQVLRCQAFEHHGSCRFQRRCHRAVCGEHTSAGMTRLFAAAAWRFAGQRPRSLTSQARDALTDGYGFHNAGSFHAQFKGHGQSVQTTALVHVDEVEANGFVARISNSARPWLNRTA